MSETHPVNPDFANQANLNADQYKEMYERSVNDPEGFWAEQAEKYLTWFKPWDKVTDWSFDQEDLRIKWFDGAKLNVSYNCLDRHLDTRGDQVAIIWEGDSPEEERKITYRELHAEVSKFANALKSQGVTKGDRVCLYLPMIPSGIVGLHPLDNIHWSKVGALDPAQGYKYCLNCCACISACFIPLLFT